MNEFKDRSYKINLEDIKSSYNITQIFSYLYEKEKLDIIIYSKEFQKIASVDIQDYKIISGKYKI